jgi:mannose-1-phosphate guanylyltransferase
MKAFLLAAGLGTRLRPLTDITPKCLINICNKPLLDWWIKLFEMHGVDEVLINLHHLSEKVIKYLEDSDTKIKFHLFYEEKLLGSGGTLRENKNFVKDERNFFICYADNLTNYNLSKFLDFHKSKNNPFSMALFKTDTPSTKGIAILGKDDLIVEFEEKPKIPKSNLANAGLYISSPEILEMIPNKEITDVGFDLLPTLVGRMNGWETKDYLIDIGNPSDLARAEKEWKEILIGDKNEV